MDIASKFSLQWELTGVRTSLYSYIVTVVPRLLRFLWRSVQPMDRLTRVVVRDTFMSSQWLHTKYLYSYKRFVFTHTVTMDQSAVDRLFPIPAHQHKADETAFYQVVLSKFWFVSSVSSLLTIGDRHCMLGIGPYLQVGSGFARRGGRGCGAGEMKCWNKCWNSWYKML